MKIPAGNLVPLTDHQNAATDVDLPIFDLLNFEVLNLDCRNRRESPTIARLSVLTNGYEDVDATGVEDSQKQKASAVVDN